MDAGTMKNSRTANQMALQSLVVDPQGTLAKMRGKLATSLPQEMVIQEKAKTEWREKLAFITGHGIIFATILTLGFAICWATWANSRQEATSDVKKIPVLMPPTQNKTLDEQTLYWAYALYDWNNLVTTFGVSPNVLVDANKAKLELARLLPKASWNTQLTVIKYRNQERGSK
jgi:hypothetical protein